METQVASYLKAWVESRLKSFQNDAQPTLNYTIR